MAKALSIMPVAYSAKQPYLQLLLALIICTIFSQSASAESMTMVREYTYNASENDSKVSARKAALQQLQVLLIEEVGVQVQSSFSNTETLDKEEFSRTVQANYQTFASALTKTKILEEKWDGENFYLKAEIEVDPDGLSTQIATIIGSGGKNPCDAVREQVKITLQKAPSPDKNAELVAFALKAPFDNDCNDWQYNVLYSLTQSRYPATGYRDYLFVQLAQIAPHNLSEYLPGIAKYAITKDNGITPTEWETMLSSLQRLPEDRLQPLLSALSNYSDKSPDDTRSGKPSYQPQTALQLKNQLLSLIQAAEKGKVGNPALSAGELTARIIKASAYRQPAIGAELFQQYSGELPDINDMVKPITDFYKNQLKAAGNQELASNSFNLLLEKLNEQKDTLNDNTAKTMYYLLTTLERNAEENQQQAALIENMLGRYPKLFAQIIKGQRINEVQKNLWFIRYNLPDSEACTPRECADRLFGDGNAMELNAYGEYLVAYGTRAAAAEDLVIRKLERVRVQASGPYRTTMKRHLITVLGNIRTQDLRAQELLIESLGDLDHKIPEEAQNALIKLGRGVQEKMMSMISTYEPLVQRRMVETLGKMQPDTDIVNFLKRIPQNDQYMRFAVEDALRDQQRAL
jgi:hypothetical protein